jgi:hypothetical protein
MNIRTAFIAAAIAATALASCTEDTTTQPPVSGNEITTDTIAGAVKGTMKGGKTYYLAADATVAVGDTLTIEAGAKLIDLTNHSVFVKGSIIANGTRTSPIYMGPADSRKEAGAWGGIEADSPSVVTLKFVQLMYAGGLRSDNRSRPAFYFFSNAAMTSKVYIEDCEISYTKDDAIQINGGKGWVKRSVFRMNGIVEGCAANLKNGFIGDVAYNYVWSSNDHGLWAQNPANLLPRTSVNIYNNTLVNFGFKNPSRPGAGVFVDKLAQAKIYNNIIVNGMMGIRITAAADTQNVFYGNNLFFATVDSLRSRFYPTTGIASPRPTDLIQVDPRFVVFDPNISATTDGNTPTLQPGSPAIGAGNPTYDPDLGAYTAKR